MPDHPTKGYEDFSDLNLDIIDIPLFDGVNIQGQVNNASNTLSGRNLDMSALGAQLQALADLNKLEQNDNLIKQKSLFESLSQYTVNPSLGIFRDGGMNMSGIANPFTDFSQKVAAVSKTGESRFILDMLERAPIQAEKGEVLAHNSGVITEVSATKTHEQMGDDEVTDFVPTGSYVFSKNGFEIIRSQAEKIITDVKIPPYDKFKKTKPPEETTLADFMKKKDSMSPADIARNIAKEYEQTSGEDVISRKTNELNLENSMPAIKALITLSEVKKQNMRTPVVKQENTQPDTTGREAVNAFSKGGYVRKKDVTKANLGFLQVISSLLTQPLQIAQGFGNELETKRQAKKNTKAIDKLAETQSQFAQAGSLAGIASVLGQDPTVDAPVLETGFLNQIPTKTPQSVLDNLASGLAGQTNQDAVFENAPSFAAATSALGQTNVQNASALGQAGIKAFQDFQNRKTSQLAQFQDIINRNKLSATGAKNQTVANQNRQLGAVGGQVQGGLSNLSNIETNRQTSQIANSNNEFNNILGTRNKITDSLTNAMSAASGQAASALASGQGGGQTFNASNNLNPNSNSITSINALSTPNPFTSLASNQNKPDSFSQSIIDAGFTPAQLQVLFTLMRK